MTHAETAIELLALLIQANNSGQPPDPALVQRLHIWWLTHQDLLREQADAQTP